MTPALWALPWFASSCLAGDLSAGGHLVGPGALAKPGRPGRQGPDRWIDIHDWPVGFVIMGSSISDVNGLYSLAEIDHRLPHACQVAWKNEDSSWQMAHVQVDSYTPLPGGRRSDVEWLLMDGEGRNRFGCPAGERLPLPGEYWKHLHRSFRSFKVGDRVKTRKREAGLWEAGEEGIIFKTAFGPDPLDVKLLNGDRHFSTQGWRFFHIDDEESVISADATPGDDEDELPWQIVAILDEGKMQELRMWKNQHREAAVKAIAGSIEGFPFLPAGESEPQIRVDDLHPDIQEGKLACRSRNMKEGHRLLDQMLEASHEAGLLAVLHVEKAFCYRRSSETSLALQQTDLALASHPRFAEALFQRALALLDAGSPAEAVSGFRLLLQANRSWPELSEWLLHAHARAQHHGKDPLIAGFYTGDLVETAEDLPGFTQEGDRARVLGFAFGSSDRLALQYDPPLPSGRVFVDALPVQAGNAAAPLQAAEDHYTVLGLPADFTAEELRTAYRQLSLKNHPDKGGSNEAYQRISVAHSVLKDPGQRQAYDSGADLLAPDGITLRNRVERFYFPERQGWRPFGDPLERKKQIQEKRRRSEL